MTGRSTTRAVGLIFVLGLFTATSTAHADTFVPGCAIPFAAISVNQPIDTQCGNEGSFNSGDTDSPQHRAQNRAKNYLCATGTPSRVTAFTMKKLQQITNQKKAAHQLKFGARDILPDDRTVLQNLWTTSDGNTIGEGSVVVFVGFVQKTKAGESETVNCHLSGIDNNDIHIALADSKQVPECNSFVAEMIPHLRPTSWNRTKIDQIQKPVRITGSFSSMPAMSPVAAVHRLEVIPSGYRIGKSTLCTQSMFVRRHRLLHVPSATTACGWR